MTKQLPIQPTLNMGIVGHVDHGKTTLTKILSGKWTDTHSEEKKRGITIKLGYTNFSIFEDGDKLVTKLKKATPIRNISIVDAPGHESFMATMISGAAIMDCALLLVAANEKCPQPQTIEHLKTLEIAGIKDIIVIQNKVDLVNKEEAMENFKEIQAFLKGTVAETAPVIPLSAQHGANISELLKAINVTFKDPVRNTSKDPSLYIVRSFDINKPGQDYTQLKGGVLGGSIKEGTLKDGDDIEIRPGLMKQRDGKISYEPIYATVKGLMSDKDKLTSAIPGGSVAIMTELDPAVTKTDSLVGQIAGLKGSLPEPCTEITFDQHMFEKITTSTGEHEVKANVPNEPLMLIVNSLTTVGIVSKVNTKQVTVKLKRPVMAFNGDRVVIFKQFGTNKWKIMGYGIIKGQ